MIAPLHPCREALVQLGTALLRQRLVGGVADQRVTEGEAALAGQRHRSRPSSCLRVSASSTTSSRAPSPAGASAATASRQNSLPTTEAAPIAWSSSIGSRSRRAASSAWIVGRDRDGVRVVLALADQREHLLHEERIALRAAHQLGALSSLSGPSRSRSSISATVSASESRSSRTALEPRPGVRPRRALLRELLAGQADEQERSLRGVEQELDQIE